MYTVMYMALKRKQVYLEHSQDRRIKRWAKAHGVPEAEIIRRSIDLGLHRMAELQIPSPEEAAAELLASIDALIEAGAVDGGRTWTRDDLYDRGE